MNSKLLIDLLESSDPYVQADAAIQLGQNKVMAVAPRLRELCSNDHQLVALSALHSSWLLGEENLPIKHLLNALKSEDEEIRQLAVQVVSARGEQLISQITPLLTGSLEDIELAVLVLEEVGGLCARKELENLRTDDPHIQDLVDEALDDWE